MHRNKTCLGGQPLNQEVGYGKSSSPPIWTATNCAAAGFDIRNLMWAFALFKLALIQLAYQLNQYNSNGFGKGRVREGKILSLQGFPSRIELLHNRSFNQASTIFS